MATTTSIAHADDAADIKRLNEALKHPAAGPGLETARPGPAAWCATAHPKAGMNYGWMDRDLESYQREGYWSKLIEIAGNVCAMDQHQPVVQALVAEIAQMWINLTGLSAKNAVVSLAARVDAAAMDAGKEKLCNELKVSDEVTGEDAQLMKARRVLFGCSGTNGPLWSEKGTTDRELIEYLDQSASDPDEIVRLAYVTEHSRVGLGQHDLFYEHSIPAYAIRNIDFKLLSDDKVVKALSAPPYAGNPYARALVLESLATSHMGIAALDAEVKKRTSDTDWKELLIDAPARGAEAYAAEAAKYKAEIARSNDAERKLMGPSKKANAGCEVTLRKDLIGVWKTLKHATEHEAKESLSDPVLGLLFSRYVGCVSVDGGDGMYARRMYPVMSDLRHGRGIRMAAYYSVLEAAAKIHADRDRFPVKPDDFAHLMPSGKELADVVGNGKLPQHDTMGFVGDNARGIVKSAVKTGDVVVITFQNKSHKEMRYNCVDTNKLMSIDDSGHLHYYQHCTEAGMVTINDTPTPVSIPVLFADKIAAGTVLEVETTRGHDAKERWAFPLWVYSDASKKKLVNWYGFAI